MTKLPKKSPALAGFLGEELHKAFKLYFYNKRTRVHQKDPFKPIHKQLDTALCKQRKSTDMARKNTIIFEGWTQDDLRKWIIGCVKCFIDFFEAEDVTWFREEWSLSTIYITPEGKHIKHLGEPDIVFYSQRRKSYLILDFKTANNITAYFQKDKMRLTEKLLAYAFGARQKIYATKRLHMHAITIGYVVFIRKKVVSGEMPEMHIFEEFVSKRRLNRWRKNHVKQYT